MEESCQQTFTYCMTLSVNKYIHSNVDTSLHLTKHSHPAFAAVKRLQYQRGNYISKSYLRVCPTSVLVMLDMPKVIFHCITKLQVNCHPHHCVNNSLEDFKTLRSSQMCMFPS